jgi:cytidine deaminase
MTTGKKPEIYLALCGAAGTDLDQTCNLLTKELHAYGYTAKVITISSIFAKLSKFSEISKITDEGERISASMDAGNEIRQLAGGDAAARLVVAEIRDLRSQESSTKSPDDPTPGVAYIIKSLKHEEECLLFRRLYKDAFVLISVYEPRARRIKNLAKRMAKNKKLPLRDCEPGAELLIDRDQNEPDFKYGQHLREVFPLADIFVEAGSSIDLQIRRLGRLMFGAPFMTPRREEFGMYHAQAAALKSADLSRQVGAVILTDDAEIISSGCNEVPKVGGGVIWAEDISSKVPDRRDYSLGYDTSAVMKRDMLREVVTALRAGDWLTDAKASENTEALIDELLDNQSKSSLTNARITSVIEFGRIVHAEMSALMDAARRGSSVKDKSLYCTVFPCHMCARHIIAAGIRRVVYIEPYPKSLAKQLYENEILVDDELSTDLKGVRFEPFVGVAPRRYASWFAMSKRKDKQGWALADIGSAANRKVAVDVYLPPSEEVAYVASLSVLDELDKPGG